LVGEVLVQQFHCRGRLAASAVLWRASKKFESKGVMGARRDLEVCGPHRASVFIDQISEAALDGGLWPGVLSAH
jgi:hypothetical protein